MKRAARGAAIAFALALLPFVAGRLAPGFMNELRSKILGDALIVAIGALSLNLLVGYAGQISLGHGAFVGVGALTVGLVTGRAGAAFLVGLPAAALGGAVFAFLVGLPALRIRGLYLAISTVAFAEAMTRFVFPLRFISGGQTGIPVPRPRVGSFAFDRNSDYVALIAFALALVWFLDRNVTRSRLGRAMLGIREDEQVASSFGVNVPRTKLVAFVIAGALAGIAGALQGPLTGVAQSNVFGFDASLFFLMVVVVGGLGSRAGVVTAALMFTALPRLLIGLQRWDTIVGAALLIFTIARHPGGIAQALLEARERKAKPEEEEREERIPALPAIASTRSAVAPGGRPLLDVRDLAIRFGGVQALDGASVAVPSGTIVGLIGPNGAGKTTFFNCVSGFLSPERGRVEFAGRDITALPPHSRMNLGMGRTFQQIGLARALTVTENFLLAQDGLAGYGALHSIVLSRRARAAEAEMLERAREAIAALGFERFADQQIRALSGGQQRLVELGCALVSAPDLLLLDEPSAGMSPAATESLAERLREIRDRLGRTVLLIEHHIPLVMNVCDEVAVLNLGKVLTQGPTDAVIRDPAVVAAYLGEEVA